MKIANPVGRKGEELAAHYLQKKGYQIIERNYNKRYGELDIVATHNNTLVFIEVKTRISTKYGLPIEAISPWKLNSLLKTAEYYKYRHPRLPDSLRIDLIAITLSNAEEVISIEHIENISD